MHLSTKNEAEKKPKKQKKRKKREKGVVDQITFRRLKRIWYEMLPIASIVWVVNNYMLLHVGIEEFLYFIILTAWERWTNAFTALNFSSLCGDKFASCSDPLLEPIVS